MKRGSLFTRLLTAFLAVILACVGVLYVLIYTQMRSSRIDSRIQALKSQARDVAYLSSRLQSDKLNLSLSAAAATKDYLYWKSSRIYDQYGAYTLVVERTGRTTAYYLESAMQDKSLRQMPGTEEMTSYLDRAVQGEEITVTTQSASGPLFTVIVPCVQFNQLTNQNTVIGIVMIQTAAQTIHAVYRDLIWQVALVALGVFVLAGVCAFFLTRQMTQPLSAMSSAAQQMARGDFSARAPEAGSAEIRELAVTFNGMAQQLSTLENSRRDFVANVSHELRSPITSIQGFAQGILDGTVPEEDREKYLRIIVDETHRLSKLIGGLLNLSRMENDTVQLAKTIFDVNEMVRRVLIARMNQIDDKQLNIEANLQEEPCYVLADADQIEQVIINLVDNAVKFTPEGGVLTLSTCTEGGTVYLRVKDNGVGILPQDAPHIFDRFYKADKAHTVGKGTGLGLAICRIIMEKHGQSIRLVSGEGGAEFEITLEKSDPPEERRHADDGLRKD